MRCAGRPNQHNRWPYLPLLLLDLTIPTLRIRICDRRSGGVALESIKTNALLHGKVQRLL